MVAAALRARRDRLPVVVPGPAGGDWSRVYLPTVGHGEHLDVHADLSGASILVVSVPGAARHLPHLAAVWLPAAQVLGDACATRTRWPWRRRDDPDLVSVRAGLAHAAATSTTRVAVVHGWSSEHVDVAGLGGDGVVVAWTPTLADRCDLVVVSLVSPDRAVTS